MTKTTSVSGPISSGSLIQSGATCTTRFTPQVAVAVQGCLLPDGWEVVSVRRVGFCEVEVGGIIHGLEAKPFTLRPRADMDVAYHIEPRDEQHGVVCLEGEGATVCPTEALEMAVRNSGKERAVFKSWWCGKVEARG